MENFSSAQTKAKKMQPCASKLDTDLGSLLKVRDGHKIDLLTPVIPNRGPARHTRGAVSCCQGCRQLLQFPDLYTYLTSYRGAAKCLQV